MPATAIAVTRVSLLMNGEKNEFLIVMAIVSCWLAMRCGTARWGRVHNGEVTRTLTKDKQKHGVLAVATTVLFGLFSLG